MIALARKYRPKQFADLVAQDHVAAALRGAVAQGRVAHGYLFAGPRGVGKTTAARILAMALNCEQRTAAGEPCGACDSCSRIWTGAANLDVVELDAASNRGVDDARDLRERAMYAASGEARSKVYIVDEAHMLTREAWNALLKILEEPPPRVVFVFATTEPQKIANTAAPILSRLQRFDFRRIGPHAIVARLAQVVAAERLEAEDDALHLIAKSANGGMRDGLSLLDQVLSFGEGPVTAARVREVLGLIPDESYGEMLRCIVERDAAAVFRLVDRLLEAGADLGEFVSGAGETLRAVLLVGVGGGQPEGLTEGLLALVHEYAPRLPPADVVRLLTVLGESEESVRRSGNTRLAVEVLLLRWAMADRTVEIGQVLQALGSREPGTGSGNPAPSRSPSAQPPAPPELRDSAAPLPAPRSPLPAPAEKGPLSLERLRSIWPQIVADARARAPMLGSLLAEAEVTAVEARAVTLRPASTGHGEGLERQREVIAQVIGRYLTEATPPRVKLAAGAAAERDAPSGRPVRLTEERANADRLTMLRAKDPTLSAAVDALDLELLE
ncbi:MAG TPA: DNA polymerase III subunit gamma/tau [Gemmatimonadales bacterium]|nr:DNA polymerase III subunit gamma/tau [Gemmatimonadales bacterium]